MSNGKTKVLFEGTYTRVEALADGKPLGRPIRFHDFRNGCYLSIAEAKLIALELLSAVSSAEFAG